MYAGWYMMGRWGKQVTHSYPLPQLKDAILMQMSNESLKVVLEPNKGE